MQTILPPPIIDGRVSVEKALANRRSIRQYQKTALNLQEIGQLLWAAQGVTKRFDRPSVYSHNNYWPGGLTTAPSAGALYPLQVYLLAGNVKDLQTGWYRYLPNDHTLLLISTGDRRKEVCRAALNQEAILKAPACIVIAANYARTAQKYGDRALRYVHMEVGHVAQNVYLQAYCLGIGTVMIGAFDDKALKTALKLPLDQDPLAILPLGRIEH